VDDFETKAHLREALKHSQKEVADLKFALDESGCAKESLRLAVDVCPTDLRSNDPLSGRGHQVLLIPGLPEVRFH
jgi:butyrate kinase